jgi:hypothetical protein
VFRHILLDTFFQVFFLFKKLDETVRGEGGFGSTGIGKIIENDSKKARMGV